MGRKVVNLHHEVRPQPEHSRINQGPITNLHLQLDRPGWQIAAISRDLDRYLGLALGQGRLNLLYGGRWRNFLQAATGPLDWKRCWGWAAAAAGGYSIAACQQHQRCH